VYGSSDEEDGEGEEEVEEGLTAGAYHTLM